MIRRITKQEIVSVTVSKFCKELKTYTATNGSRFTGEMDTSYSARISQATDNSIYQALPQGILFPRNTDDILVLTELANQDKYLSLRFSPKGGGTGTNGQSLTDHLIVDMSRHMREILEINVEQKWVRVQTGVIKDQLNDFLRPYGFFFAPDLSTSNRATIGGMVNTDASGQGSLVYGKTSDHVLELEAVTISGDKLCTMDMPVVDAQALANGSSALSGIYKQVLDTCTNQRENILSTFPRLNRFLTGYDLEHVFNEDMSRFNLSRILTGSEGTLAFITEAKLNITPIAKYKTMVNVKYDNFDSALRNSPFLVEANATSVETVDSKVLNLAKQDVVWDSVSDLITDVPNQTMNGLNIVEYNDEDAENQKQKIQHLCKRLDALIANNNENGVIGYQIIEDLSAINKIYGMRKKAVGLLGNAKSTKKPIAFVEDTAVPPEHLADFIAEFRALLDSHELDYGMFGHVDAGVLHVRPALDLSDPKQEQLLRVVSDQVVKLTAKYKGLMWGEHGRGYRSEYGPEFFGETLFNELRKVKTSFDPSNRLNPGKICTPIDSSDKLVSVDGVKRAHFDKQIPLSVVENFETTVNCNGNGLCFNYDVNSPMCPSYKHSKDRAFSPKGRANLMREWIRLQGESITNEQLIRSRDTIFQLMTLPYKAFRSLGAKMGVYDYSHEVKHSMDNCLACKACSTACPIKVDVPSFRAKFLDMYHQRYFRPLSDYLVANIEHLLPTLAKTPKLSNLIMNNPVSAWATRNIVGYLDAPLFSEYLNSNLKDEFKFSKNKIEALSESEQAKAVFIVQDPFTSFYESQLLLDTVTALKGLGFMPFVLPFKENGKPAHVKGFLAKFKRTASKASVFYNKIAKYNTPMVGMDASLVFAYRDEYIEALGADKVNYKVSLLSEWLWQQDFALSSDTLATIANNETQQFNLMTHCTEKSVLPNINTQWQTIFSKLNMNIKPINTGCCGMAGTFGHEAKNQQASSDIYALSWKPALQQADENPILVTGFSCRSQVKRYESQKLKHPIQVVAELFK
ncbi:FAD-binding and (Fe-S)-binding domain-containing protein [uncultured Psychrosphaera sp.]|uniref:D-2-hydroxyglutarate dehydrogenase YdiJ n=1 Tax=uncultured Psychrosphaera sp. TaxID=1403522 RepID=UPI00262B23AF|nr:FAD-binding and (Fe-S)-binding domain-containing protein [uncultured Psychrosphaera sp.]